MNHVSGSARPVSFDRVVMERSCVILNKQARGASRRNADESGAYNEPNAISRLLNRLRYWHNYFLGSSGGVVTSVAVNSKQQMRATANQLLNALQPCANQPRDLPSLESSVVRELIHSFFKRVWPATNGC